MQKRFLLVHYRKKSNNMFNVILYLQQYGIFLLIPGETDQIFSYQ